MKEKKNFSKYTEATKFGSCAPHETVQKTNSSTCLRLQIPILIRNSSKREAKQMLL